MKRVLLRSFSSYGRDLLSSHFNGNPNPSPHRLLSLSASIRPVPRLYSSKNNPNDEAHFPQIQKKDAPIDAEGVSNEELKKLIGKLEEGDKTALPSIFEAILKRKLSGKHKEADDELMREIFGNERKSEDNIEDEEELEFDSELEDMMSETDEEE